jgi:DNA-binding HxlR family transcriptional regulator
MALLDLLGRRWALRVLWELRDVALTFRALQDACGGTSPTVLNQRLKELRESGLVELGQPDGYALTPLGLELLESLMPLVEWSKRWARAAESRPSLGRDASSRRVRQPATLGSLRVHRPR